MTEFFDALETRSPAEREAAQMAALPAQVAHAQAHSAAMGEILKDVDAASVTSRAALATLPVTRKHALLDRQKKLERELESLKARAAGAAVADLGAAAREVGGIKVLAARVEDMDAKALREAVDQLKQQLRDAVVLLAGAGDGKVALVAGVSGAALGPVKAGELLAHVAGQIGGKGGGRPDLAQGGGEDGPRLRTALEGIHDWVAGRLG